MTLRDSLLSHVSGHKTAMVVGNHCDEGCIPRRLGKQEWRGETIVVAQVMCWSSLWFSGPYLCHETVLAKTAWARQRHNLANSLHMSDSTSSVDPLLETIQQVLESIPFEAFILCRAKLNFHLEVQVFGKNVETWNYIRKGAIIKSEPERKLKSKPSEFKHCRQAVRLILRRGLTRLYLHWGSRGNVPSRHPLEVKHCRQALGPVIGCGLSEFICSETGSKAM